MPQRVGTNADGDAFLSSAGDGGQEGGTYLEQFVGHTVRPPRMQAMHHREHGDPRRLAHQVNATQPESEDLLGNISISRETGLMPIPMIPGDTLRLAGQEDLADVP